MFPQKELQKMLLVSNKFNEKNFALCFVGWVERRRLLVFWGVSLLLHWKWQVDKHRNEIGEKDWHWCKGHVADIHFYATVEANGAENKWKQQKMSNFSQPRSLVETSESVEVCSGESESDFEGRLRALRNFNMQKLPIGFFRIKNGNWVF